MTKREEDGKRMLDFFVTQVHKAYPTKPTTLSHTPATMLGYNSTRIAPNQMLINNNKFLSRISLRNNKFLLILGHISP